MLQPCCVSAWVPRQLIRGSLALPEEGGDFSRGLGTQIDGMKKGKEQVAFWKKGPQLRVWLHGSLCLVQEQSYEVHCLL